ncbi:MAG TPA: hypothetical protein VIU44_05330 [Gaiellaceae bacterium]
MAKTGRGKEKDAAKAQAEAAKAQASKQSTLVLISPQALKQLLKDDDRYKDDIDGLVGELRETIGNAVDKKKLDKKAYALLKRFHREKSNEKLSNLWHTLLAYMDMAGVMKRIESVSELPLDGEKANGEESEEVEASSEEPAEGAEVVKPQFGGRRVPAQTH